MNTSLNQHLRALIPSSGESITLQGLLDRMGERGILLMMILLNIPFSLPVPIPSLSTPFGLALLFLCAKLAWGIPQKLPHFLGKREIPPSILKAIIEKSLWALEKLEKKLRHRLLFFCESTLFRFLNISLCFLMAFILMLPLVVPLTNCLPALTLIFLALGMMEKDGLIVYCGYVLAFLTGIFFYLLYYFGTAIFDWVKIPAKNFIHQLWGS